MARLAGRVHGVVVQMTIDGVAVWKERAVSFREMADAGILFDDLVRLATEASQLDPDIARRVKLWGADCAAHVLPIFEREMPGDTRPREAIEAARPLSPPKRSSAGRDVHKADDARSRIVGCTGNLRCAITVLRKFVKPHRWKLTKARKHREAEPVLG